jgi:uncharacterized PurR-regulated membrane protein YhhQ (DUF165 family)
MKYLNTAVYIALIVLVNWAFTIVPLVKLPDGTMWPPVALIVGFVFVARDFAQREIGHYVLAAMAVGVAISYFMNPQVAMASAAAFLISELADWAVYSFTRRPLSQRILFSSILGTPIDTVVLHTKIGFFSVTRAGVMTASQHIGAFIVWWLIRRREMTGAISA